MNEIKDKQERTVVIIKPDGVKRGLVGEIISRFERRGLKIISLSMMKATRAQIDEHYPKDKAWVTNLGTNTMDTYIKYESIEKFKEDYGTDDPFEVGKQVREWLLDFLTSGPTVKMVVEGVHAIDMVRKIIGKTIPAFADMGTIRGDFSVDSPALANKNRRAVRNLVHASGNKEEAKHEIEMWFDSKEVHDYQRAEEDIMF